MGRYFGGSTPPRGKRMGNIFGGSNPPALNPLHRRGESWHGRAWEDRLTIP
jgi:hypothetical protein